MLEKHRTTRRTISALVIAKTLLGVQGRTPSVGTVAV